MDQDQQAQEQELQQVQAHAQSQLQTQNQLEQLRRMEEESAKLHEMQDEIMADEDLGIDSNGVAPTSQTGVDGEHTNEDDEAAKHLSIQERQEIDNRSIYVGNIDYAATPEEVQELFKECGTINRITILTDRKTGIPMGYGFVEFEAQESIPKALELDQILFKGRPLKVIQKRTNVPGFSRGRGRGRGSFRGSSRGGSRGGFRGRGGNFRGGSRGNFRGRGGNFRGSTRGGARGGFSPY